jgi:predicted ABC-type ATPase
MASPAHGAPIIYVLAGVNGAGKSSIGGAALRQEGSAYFNPDEAAARIRNDLTIEDANALAWNEGTWRLEEAIESRSDYAFESTLGGNPRVHCSSTDFRRERRASGPMRQ